MTWMTWGEANTIVRDNAERAEVTLSELRGVMRKPWVDVEGCSVYELLVEAQQWLQTAITAYLEDK